MLSNDMHNFEVVHIYLCMHAVSKMPKTPKIAILGFLKLCACTDICAQPQCYAYHQKGFGMYFLSMYLFLTIHTSKVHTSGVHGTLN